MRERSARESKESFHPTAFHLVIPKAAGQRNLLFWAARGTSQRGFASPKKQIPFDFAQGRLLRDRAAPRNDKNFVLSAPIRENP
jgi:hypothetical protein